MEGDYYGLIYEGILNNKHYVGQHVNSVKYTLKRRWDGHCSPSSGCRYFRNAIQKYGKENIEWRIICYSRVGGQKRLDALERYFIKKRKSFTDGYNLTKGGSGGGIPCEETKQLMSEAAKKKFESPDARAQISAGVTKYFKENPEAGPKHGERMKQFFIDNPEAGIKHSERMKQYFIDNPEASVEHGKKMKQFFIDNPEASVEHGKKMKQFFIDNPEAGTEHSEKLKQYWDNPETRAEHSEKLKQYHKNNPDKIIRGEKNHMFGKVGGLHPNSKKIHQYSKDGKTFIKEWICARDVTIELKILASTICSVCKGKRKSAGGFFWRYATSESSATVDSSENTPDPTSQE